MFAQLFILTGYAERHSTTVYLVQFDKLLVCQIPHSVFAGGSLPKWQPSLNWQFSVHTDFITSAIQT
jgi:hypothetical protein